MFNVREQTETACVTRNQSGSPPGCCPWSAKGKIGDMHSDRWGLQTRWLIPSSGRTPTKSKPKSPCNLYMSPILLLSRFIRRFCILKFRVFCVALRPMEPASPFALHLVFPWIPLPFPTFLRSTCCRLSNVVDIC